MKRNITWSRGGFAQPRRKTRCSHHGLARNIRFGDPRKTHPEPDEADFFKDLLATRFRSTVGSLRCLSEDRWDIRMRR